MVLVLIRYCCLGRSPLPLPAAAVITCISPTSTTSITSSSITNERPDRRGEEAGQPGGEAASATSTAIALVPVSTSTNTSTPITSTNTAYLPTPTSIPTPIPRPTSIPRQAQGQRSQSSAGPMPSLQHQYVVSSTEQFAGGG